MQIHVQLVLIEIIILYLRYYFVPRGIPCNIFGGEEGERSQCRQLLSESSFWYGPQEVILGSKPGLEEEEPWMMVEGWHVGENPVSRMKENVINVWFSNTKPKSAKQEFWTVDVTSSGVNKLRIKLCRSRCTLTQIKLEQRQANFISTFLQDDLLSSVQYLCSITQVDIWDLILMILIYHPVDIFHILKSG